MLDTAARVLRLVERSPCPHPSRDRRRRPSRTRPPRRRARHRAVENGGDVLPLTYGRVCVVGQFARTTRYQGAGSFQVNPTRASTPSSTSCAAPARTSRSRRASTSPTRAATGARRRGGGRRQRRGAVNMSRPSCAAPGLSVDSAGVEPRGGCGRALSPRRRGRSQHGHPAGRPIRCRLGRGAAVRTRPRAQRWTRPIVGATTARGR